MTDYHPQNSSNMNLVDYAEREPVHVVVLNIAEPFWARSTSKSLHSRDYVYLEIFQATELDQADFVPNSNEDDSCGSGSAGTSGQHRDWVCLKLKTLFLDFRLCSPEATVLVCRQLSRLTRLEALSTGMSLGTLDGRLEESFSLSPDLLLFTMEGGLAQLGTLKQLRDVQGEAVCGDLGHRERKRLGLIGAQWMLENWSRLQDPLRSDLKLL